MCNCRRNSLNPFNLRHGLLTYLCDRQGDAKLSTFSILRFDLDVAAVSPDNSETHCQPESESSFALRREERIEDLRTNFRIHADTGIDNFDDHRVAGNASRQ